MPEQADLTPAPPFSELPAVTPPHHGSVRQGRDNPFAGDEVLESCPLEKEIIAEFNWAHEQQAKGLFEPYAGQYLAIVHKTVHAVGVDIVAMRAETAAKTGVRPERVAIFHVDTFDIY